MRLGGEVLRKQVRQTWNVLCIFFRRNSTKVLTMLEASPIYHPRDPFQSPLWNVLHNNYEEFKANYDESYEKQYGFFRLVAVTNPFRNDVVHDYLKCGDLKKGFARVRCTNPDCRNEYFLSFSCKGRWFCPSCHSKKVIKFGEDIRLWAFDRQGPKHLFFPLFHDTLKIP
jgi:hypothetical protein